MSWSKKRHNRQSWAEEVIAAAMKIEITNQEVKNPDELDDEGIVSDESTPSSSNDESITPDNNEKTTQESRKQAPIMIKEKTRKEKGSTLKAKSTMYLNEDQFPSHQGNIVRFLRSLVLSKNSQSMQKKNKVFGRDLRLHLEDTKQDIPPILRVCSKCIEHRGIVDGIYRLSGISSNIRALKSAFESSMQDNDQVLSRDEAVQLAFPIHIVNQTDHSNVRQDVHSVSSLLKLYFRELPDPLCTYKAYEDFLEAAKLPEDLRLSATRQVLSALPKENFRTLEFLMRHLHKVSLKGESTGMTAKNLAIVWAPNLLRCKDLKTAKNNNNNLKDIALQAVCTEFMIVYWDLLFANNLPTISLEKSFELGIIEGSGESREIDIDTEIRKRIRPKSVVLVTSPPPKMSEVVPSDAANSKPNLRTPTAKTVIQLKRSTSSILAPTTRKEFNLSRFLVKNNKRDQSKVEIPHYCHQPEEKVNNLKEKSATLADLSSTSSKKFRPHSSSSEASETDVAGEVDHLHLSFEQEENEMKMMSCIFDDEGESSSSNSYEHNQHIPENHNQHAKRKLNFIKKKHQNSNNSDVSGGCPKVQRSASAIFRSKVYAVVARKQKKSVTEKQDIKENKAKESVSDTPEESILQGVTFQHLDHATGQKEQEGNLAFDNRAYLSLSFPQDSGFDSYEPMKEKQFYENVKEQSDDQEEDFPSYENIEGSSESYENIRDPSSSQLNYQNLDFIPPPPILKSMPELREESYENVDFQKEIPVYAVPKKVNNVAIEEEEAPVYENYDFQEEAIYQNMVVKKGKLMPANNNNNNRRQSAPARTGDVYAQVKMLKRSVQEVNALMEPKRSDFILQRTKELEKEVTSTTFTRTVNTASVKRSSNFKSILNKFNVMQSSQSSSTTITTSKVVDNNHHQKRSLPNIKT